MLSPADLFGVRPAYTCHGQTTDITCVGCHKKFTLAVTQEQIDRWNNGELIQRAMPDLTDGERELLLSGNCDACFDAIFAASEDEEEGEYDEDEDAF